MKTQTNTSRRAAARLLATLVVALLALAPAGASAASARMDRVELKVLARFNTIRAHAGLPPLKPNADLARAADFHSRDMTRAHFFAHPSSNGQSMAARVGSFRPSHLLGEVLAYLSPGPGQARTVVRMWLQSPPHRATLLTARFRRVGIARRTGSLAGSRVTVFTADFASRG